MPLFFLSHKYARQGKHSTRFFPKKSRAEREPTPEEKPFPHKYRNKQAKHQAHPNTDNTDGNKPQSSQKISRKHIKKGRKKRGKNNTRENLLKVKQDPTWDKAEFSATTRETASDKLALLCQDATSQKIVFLIVTGGQSGQKVNSQPTCPIQASCLPQDSSGDMLSQRNSARTHDLDGPSPQNFGSRRQKENT